jgi:hypothetical protein
MSALQASASREQLWLHTPAMHSNPSLQVASQDSRK